MELEVIMVHLRAALVDLVVVVLIIQHLDLLDLVVVQAILEIQAELENGFTGHALTSGAHKNAWRARFLIAQRVNSSIVQWKSRMPPPPDAGI